MKTVPASLQAHLDGRVTTVAHGWRLTRQDGVVLGFTDHDASLVFAGSSFEAATGLTAGEAEAMLGLGAGTQEVEGALSSLSIDEADIRAGRYDGARIETFIVDWNHPEDHLLIDVSDIGEVKHGGPVFTAELRGMASRLDRRRGRIYRRRCDAAFGDARCGVDIGAPQFGRQAVHLRRSGSAFVVSGMADADFGLFADGHVRWTSGLARGIEADIAGIEQGSEAGDVRLALIDGDRGEPAAGDGLHVFAGCDKSFSTCRTRFNNGVNFRGFPHLPGNDAAMGFAKTSGLHDGSPVVP